jgi:hypothetical protein
VQYPPNPNPLHLHLHTHTPFTAHRCLRGSSPPASPSHASRLGPAKPHTLRHHTRPLLL